MIGDTTTKGTTRTMNRREFIGGGAAVAAVGTSGFAIGGEAAKKLAIVGGTPVIGKELQGKTAEAFAWPIVNAAMRKASDDVLVGRAMSGRDIAMEFERKFAAWNGTKYALSCLNGTTALNTAFYAIGIGPGDEVICPSMTMWASCMGVVNLGGTVVFCDVRKEDFNIDPASFEAHITPRTKAVVVVHYMGSPCDMDPIMAIARKHGLKVVEDVSHAQGGLYKGRKLGTIGDVGAMSLMSGKSFAIGEAGMLVTDSKEIYEKSIRWGMYIRLHQTFDANDAQLKRTREVPLGGIKNRLNQCTCAIGLEQLKKYDRECAEIEKAMLYYHKGISDVKGLKMIYPKWEKSNKAGWYSSRCLYDPEAFGGCPVTVFAAALNAETGTGYSAGCNFPLHWSSVFDDEDIFGNGQPPSRRFLPDGVTPKKLAGELPNADWVNPHCLGDPWFKHFDPALIDRYIEAVHKVAAGIAQLKDYKGEAGWAFWS